MAEEISNLIEKIYSEGVEAAQVKAEEIEKQATQEAQGLVNKAKKEAEALVSQARERIRLMEEKSKTLLIQASRDLLLSLRKEINTLLGRIIITDLRCALSPDALSKIIFEAIKNYAAKTEHEIEVTLKPEDVLKLKEHFLSRLKEQSGKDIILKPSENILGGFTISFDSGKSQFDFTDKALAEYIGLYLKPNLSAILNEAVK